MNYKKNSGLCDISYSGSPPASSHTPGLYEVHHKKYNWFCTQGLDDKY